MNILNILKNSNKPMIVFPSAVRLRFSYWKFILLDMKTFEGEQE